MRKVLLSFALVLQLFLKKIQVSLSSWYWELEAYRARFIVLSCLKAADSVHGGAEGQTASPHNWLVNCTVGTFNLESPE